MCIASISPILLSFFFLTANIHTVIHTEEDQETSGSLKPEPRLYRPCTKAPRTPRLSWWHASLQEQLGPHYLPGHCGDVSKRLCHFRMSQGFCPTDQFHQLWALVRKQTHLNIAQNKTECTPSLTWYSWKLLEDVCHSEEQIPQQKHWGERQGYLVILCPDGLNPQRERFVKC